MMSFWDLHNNVAASQERINALADELAKEKKRKKTLQRALEVAAKKARAFDFGGRGRAYLCCWCSH